jgi:hypothetical protein
VAASTRAGTPLEAGKPHGIESMTAVAVIAVFFGVILLLNIVDFGRLD